MRVEAGKGEPRLRDAEALPQLPRDDPAGQDDQVRGQGGGHVREGDMHGHGHDRQLFAPEHHHRVIGFSAALGGKSGEKLRMAGMPEAGLVEHVLGDGIGHDGRCRARANQAHRRLDGFDDGWRIGRIGPPRMPRKRTPSEGMTGRALEKAASIWDGSTGAMGTVQPYPRAIRAI